MGGPDKLGMATMGKLQKIPAVQRTRKILYDNEGDIKISAVQRTRKIVYDNEGDIRISVSQPPLNRDPESNYRNLQPS